MTDLAKLEKLSADYRELRETHERQIQSMAEVIRKLTLERNAARSRNAELREALKPTFPRLSVCGCDPVSGCAERVRVLLAENVVE
jgi:hypothetical protein